MANSNSILSFFWQPFFGKSLLEKINEFIKSTANDFCSILRRSLYAEVVCVTAHLNEFDDHLRDGYERQPHIHIMWYCARLQTRNNWNYPQFHRNFQGYNFIHINIKVFIYIVLLQVIGLQQESPTLLGISTFGKEKEDTPGKLETSTKTRTRWASTYECGIRPILY